ncbi:MAG: hypothetical protein DSM106950_09990 [Stigonema ocellatum SAG 48.90 = DSM 106950]|nr:hypothetical protein [Stigonema ocellatum SAG 48.90 = DSM 106950]
MNTENQESQKSIQPEKASTTAGDSEVQKKPTVQDDPGDSRSPTVEDRGLGEFSSKDDAAEAVTSDTQAESKE